MCAAHGRSHVVAVSRLHGHAEQKLSTAQHCYLTQSATSTITPWLAWTSWHDASEAAWSAEVKTAQGRTVPASETLWIRTREVWIYAVDLDVRPIFCAISEVMPSTLLEELPSKWRAGLVRWAASRGTSSVDVDVEALRWL